MKRIFLSLYLITTCVTLSYGAALSFSGSSSKFVVDTRPDVAIEDVTSYYCSGEYGGHGGRCATFLTGIDCNIEFKIKSALREGRKLSHYLINGQPHYPEYLGHTFTFNVGSLEAYRFLRVVAVDTTDKRSKPFRVNVEIAPLPPAWNITDYVYGLNELPGDRLILIDRYVREHRLVYRWSLANRFELFNAFSDLLKIGNENMQFSFQPTIPYEQTMDSSTGQYLLGVNSGGRAEMQAGDISANNIKNLVKKVRTGRLGILDIWRNLTGGVAWNYNPRQGTWTFGYNEFGINFGGSAKFRQRVPSCPLIYGEIGLWADTSILAHYENDAWRAVVNLDPLVELRATVGIGYDSVLAAEVSGSAGLHVKAAMPGGLERIYLKGKFFWRAVFVTHERSGTWWEADLDIYPRPTSGTGGGGELQSSPRLALLDVSASPSGGYTDSGFKPVPRNYGDGLIPAVRRTSGRAVLLSASGADDAQILMHDGYPTPQPALAVSGSNAALAYVRDNAARSDLDRTEIVFREELSDGQWGNETHVWDDGTADFHSKLVLLPDGTVIAAWANAKQSFADGTPFETVCASLESAVGVRDPQSGTWTCTNLTDDAALDWVPVLKGATNGTAAVAWVRNAAGSYIGTAAQPSDLAVSFYRNGSWSPMAIAVAGVGTVLSHDIAWDGERAVLTWAADADGDLSTEDTEIWARSFENGAWSLPVRLSAQSAVATRPFAWYLTNGVPHVVWVQNGALFAADGLTAASCTNVTMAAELSIPGDYRISVREDGSATLLWTSDPLDSKSGLKGGVVSADYTPDAGLAASATLLKREGYLRNLSSAMDANGTFRVAYESVAVSTNAEGQLVRGAVDLAVTRRDAIRDVGITADDCSFAADVDVGVTNKLLVGIQNYGTVASGTFEYRVWAGEGDDKMLLASGESNVSSLSRALIEVPWTPVEGLTNVAFTIEVDVNNAIGDSRRENNALIWRPDVGSPLISLRNAKAVKATDTLRLVSARIHNDAVAPLPAGMAVKFWRGEIGGELIGTDTAGLVAGGNVGEYDVGVAWDITGVTFTSEWERVVIELPAEQGGRSVAVWTPTPLYDPDNDIEPGGGGGGDPGGGETPSAPPNIGGITGFGEVDGSRYFHFYFYGEAGFTYLVQYKEKLTDAEWTTIETVTPTTTGECPVAVPIVTSAPSGFYRVVANP